MPDLDRELAVLRDALRESVPQPELDTLVRRQEQRASRRRRQLAAVAAVLVVGAAIPVLRTGLRPVADQPPPGQPAATRSYAGTLPPWISSGPGTYIYNVRWSDRAHGFALRGTCTGEPGNTDCTTDLLGTEDGAHWYRFALPAPDGKAESGLFQQLYVLGPGRLVVEAPRERWYSGDFALTWHKVPIERSQVVAAIPPGAVLEPQCAVVTTVCRQLGEMLVMMPDSGRSAALANPPPLRMLAPTSAPARDGSWWVSGFDPATGRWGLAVSRDAGRTWSVGLVPPFDGTPYAGLSVTVSPTAVYATAVGALPGVRNGLLAIFRSTDGGKTWERTWQGTGATEPRSLRGVAVAAADGRLIISTESTAGYTSTDGGRTFQRDIRLNLGYVEWNYGGYFASATYPSNTYVYSADGITWTPFTVG